MPDDTDKKENVNITISDSQLKAGRDVSLTGIKKETRVENVSSGSLVNVGDENSLVGTEAKTAYLAAFLIEWQAEMITKIDALPHLLEADKADVKETIAKIKTEAAKAEKVDPGRLERLLNSLAAMAPEIFEVAIATLVSPLHGIGLVMKKIGDKATLEFQTKEP